MTTVKVSSPAELLDALTTANDIEVDGSLTGMPMITLRPGPTLRGGTLRFCGCQLKQGGSSVPRIRQAPAVSEGAQPVGQLARAAGRYPKPPARH